MVFFLSQPSNISLKFIDITLFPNMRKGPEQQPRPFECKMSIPLWLIVSFRLLNIKAAADDKFPKKIISFYQYFWRNKSLSFQ